MTRPNKLERWVTSVCDDQQVFARIEELHFFANGVFSNVYKGRLVSANNQTIVLKKTWTKGPVSLKEVVILSELSKFNHPNIIQLLYLFKSTNHPDNRVCYGLIFEYMPITLYKHMRQFRTQGRTLNLIDVKLYAWQLFRAQAHLARHNVCHRDIKPQNILIIEPGARNNCYQITRYYRPPELLLRATKYGTEADVWSCGCVFGELLRGRSFLHGQTSSHQLELIVCELGMPTDLDYRAMRCPNRVHEFEDMPIFPGKFRNLLPQAPEEALHLLSRILIYNPSNRLYGSELLADRFFDDIFTPGATRTNGQAVTILSREDRQRALGREVAVAEINN
ncbi:protein kinase domain-containing protein [Ditylenchus destructor]|uniref:Protein kinase domain-containing protein n=1 Tax=Ditylenchus destructor TaxID=166010 RepID=A0AAD4N1V7_9BILA|nr:protein kinase domain-containing protein [Ditylenchus destructor]